LRLSYIRCVRNGSGWLCWLALVIVFSELVSGVIVGRLLCGLLLPLLAPCLDAAAKMLWSTQRYNPMCLLVNFCRRLLLFILFFSVWACGWQRTFLIIWRLLFFCMYLMRPSVCALIVCFYGYFHLLCIVIYLLSSLFENYRGVVTSLPQRVEVNGGFLLMLSIYWRKFGLLFVLLSARLTSYLPL